MWCFKSIYSKGCPVVSRSPKYFLEIKEVQVTAKMVSVIGTDKSLGDPQIVSMGKAPPPHKNTAKKKREKRRLA